MPGKADPRLGTSLVLAVALLLASLSVLGQALGEQAPRTTPRYQVDLLTVGPGELYWERFGHNAIVVSDTLTGDQISYNYGMFDFEQDNFLLNFIRGRMLYQLAAIGDAADIPYYIRSGRRVTLQSLDLDPQERENLVAFLEWNRQPEHAEYRYDYFSDNCSTRVRDALDAALGGLIRRRFTDTGSGRSYRDDVRRLTQTVPWMYLGTELGLGRPVDRPISQWQRFFLPMELSQALEDMQRADGRPLVTATQVLGTGRIVEPETAPQWWPILLLLGLALGALQWLAGHRRVAGIWWALNGSLGLGLLALWLLTDHQATAWNENLLLFCPVGLLAAFWLLRGQAQRAEPWILGLCALALLGLVLKATPWGIQYNADFIALVLPIHLAAAAAQWRSGTGRPRS